MAWDTTQLDALLPQLWRTLQLACVELHHPFRTPVLGTAGDQGCALRTVILRDVQPEQRRLVCHTDFRSPKVRDIQRQSRVEWLFYHPLEKVQLRVSGPALVHQGDDLSRQAWQRTPLPSRANYCAPFAPGTPVAEPTAAAPARASSGGLTVEQGEAGWPNFAVIVTTVERLEFLQLNSEGHRRAAFLWSGQRCEPTWLAP